MLNCPIDWNFHLYLCASRAEKVTYQLHAFLTVRKIRSSLWFFSFDIRLTSRRYLVNVFPKDIMPWSDQDSNPGPSAPDSTKPQHQNLTYRKIANWMSKNCQKLDIFFKKIDKNCHFFQQNCQCQGCVQTAVLSGNHRLSLQSFFDY